MWIIYTIFMLGTFLGVTFILVARPPSPYRMPFFYPPSSMSGLTLGEFGHMLALAAAMSVVVTLIQDLAWTHNLVGKNMRAEKVGGERGCEKLGRTGGASAP